MKLNVFFAALMFLASCSAQKSGLKQSLVADMVENQTFTFTAQSVIPTEDARYNPRVMFPNGSQLYQLNGEYDVRITTDSVIAYLPYFGRAYTAPMNPTEGGIKFTSTNFEYKKSIRKGNYEIDIVPRDEREVRNLFLTISPNGYATLRVLSLNKTAISYNGQIESGK